MKNGLICYDKVRFDNNVYFAERLAGELKDFGYNMHICLIDELDNYKDIDFVVMRAYKAELTKNLEYNKIRVFNNSRISEICNDKFLTYEYLKNYDIPILPYNLLNKNNFADEDIEFPVIIKSRYGHGGTEVFFVENKSQIGECFNITGQETLIAQKVVGTVGRDLRTYIVGNKIIESIMRVSNTDFRSNFSLGGSAEIHELLPAEKSIIKKVLSALKMDFAGIDLIYDGETPVFNEIEDIVGSRMLYSKGIDAARIFANYICKQVGK